MIRREKPCVQSGEKLPEFDHMDAGATVSMSIEKRQGNAMGTLFSLGQPIPSADPCSWPLGKVTKANCVACSFQFKRYLVKGYNALM